MAAILMKMGDGRVVNVRGLDDGTGRVCIHWLVEGDGPIKVKGHPQLRSVTGQSPEVTGFIACNPKQNSVNPQTRNGQIMVCTYTNDVQAATCPKCLEFAKDCGILEKIAQIAQGS